MVANDRVWFHEYIYIYIDIETADRIIANNQIRRTGVPINQTNESELAFSPYPHASHFLPIP